MDYDLVIIGGGPSGLAAGVCAVQRNMRTVIIEAGEAGGQPGVLYPEKEITNFPCFKVVTGKEMSKNFVDHAQNKGCIIKENETAEEILDIPGGHRVVTNKGAYTAMTVIIAIGNGFFKPKKLDAPGVAEFEGRGVHYMMPDKLDFVGKKAMFVGGGNAALEMALMVCEIADTCIVHRRDVFCAEPYVIEKVKDSKIKTVMNAKVLKVEGNGKVENVLLSIGDAREKVPIDMVVIKVGMTPESETLKRWNLEMENNGIKVDQRMTTSRKGIFACGDAVAYPGKYRQIVTGMGEGATAVNSALEFIRSSEK